MQYLLVDIWVDRNILCDGISMNYLSIDYFIRWKKEEYVE